jgi:hypothetical protein
VLLAGSSAGAIGASLHAPELLASLAPSAQVKLFADSGIFTTTSVYNATGPKQEVSPSLQTVNRLAAGASGARNGSGVLDLDQLEPLRRRRLLAAVNPSSSAAAALGGVYAVGSVDDQELQLVQLYNSRLPASCTGRLPPALAHRCLLLDGSVTSLPIPSLLYSSRYDAFDVLMQSHISLGANSEGALPAIVAVQERGVDMLWSGLIIQRAAPETVSLVMHTCFYHPGVMPAPGKQPWLPAGAPPIQDWLSLQRLNLSDVSPLVLPGMEAMGPPLTGEVSVLGLVNEWWARPDSFVFTYLEPQAYINANPTCE